MNKLALTQEIDSVRSVVINGLKHYVATDFCRTIGIINSSSVLEQVDSENKKLATIETTGGDQKNDGYTYDRNHEDSNKL